MGAKYRINIEGLCLCGCGGKTNIALQTVTCSGWQKGKPLRFIMGHNARKKIAYKKLKNGCWKLKTHLINSGCGRTKIKGKGVLIHRLFYENNIGPIKKGLTLDHLCRDKACVNPEHLEPVTNAENCRRWLNTKLTMGEAGRIRKLLKDKRRTNTEIAELYGVNKCTIGDIKKGASWS